MNDDRDAERARLRRIEAEIDARYRDVPVDWSGPLDTDAEIVAAAIAMSREAEADRQARLRREIGADREADADHYSEAPPGGADDE